MAGAFRLLGKKRKLIFGGHALWTRLRREGSEGSKGSEGSVDGASPRGLWPPVGGGLCSQALRGRQRLRR